MKKILSILLALIFALLSFSCAFAANEGKIINVIYDEDTELTEAYHYGAELTLGENSIDVSPGEGIYFIFTPEKDGIYAFSSESGVFIPEKIKGDRAYGADSGVYLDETQGFRFKAGEKQNIFYYISDETPTKKNNIKITYLGEVKAVELKEKNKDLLVGDSICRTGNPDEYRMFAEFYISFTESPAKYIAYEISTFSPLKRGKNSIDVELLGKTFSIEINLKFIDDYISEVSLPENYINMCRITYTGEVTGPRPAYVVIHYTDGKTEKAAVEELDYCELTHMNDFGFKAITGWINFDENCRMLFTVCEKDYDLKSEAKKAGSVQNFLHLLRRFGLNMMGDILLMPYYLFSDEETGFFAAVKELYSFIKEDIRYEIEMYNSNK